MRMLIVLTVVVLGSAIKFVHAEENDPTVPPTQETTPAEQPLVPTANSGAVDAPLPPTVPAVQPPPVEPSTEAIKTVPVPPPQKTPQIEKFADDGGDHSWHMAVSVGLMLSAADAVYNNITASDASGTETGTALMTYGKAISTSLEGFYLPRQAWGFTGGLNYEGDREFEGGTITGSKSGLVVLVGGSNASKIQFTTLYANAAYRWNALYFPFGLNYSLVKFTPAKGFTGTHSANGGLGIQIGLGVIPANNFALELISRVNTVNVRMSDSTSTLNFGTGLFQSIILNLKYFL